jgi:hypothetical protein
MNILLALILALNIGVIVTVVLVYLKISKVFRQFVTPPGENQPSPLALLIDGIASMFSRSIVAQAKASFMGVQSGLKRQESAIAGDIAEGVVASQSPLLGGLLDSFPALKKTLRRNPQLVDMVLGFMAKQGGQPGGNQTVSIGGNGHSQAKFKL